MSGTDTNVDEIVEAFIEVLGYLTAYRRGAPAAPELGWAIRNFNEVCEALAGDEDRIKLEPDPGPIRAIRRALAGDTE